MSYWVYVAVPMAGAVLVAFILLLAGRPKTPLTEWQDYYHAEREAGRVPMTFERWKEEWKEGR